MAALLRTICIASNHAVLVHQSVKLAVPMSTTLTRTYGDFSSRPRSAHCHRNIELVLRRSFSSSTQDQERVSAPPKRGWIRRVFGIESKLEYVLEQTDLIDNEHARRLAAKTGAVVAWAFLGTSLLGTLGVDTNPLVAGLGITTLTVGFALRDIASNLMAGVMLMFSGHHFTKDLYLKIGTQKELVEGRFERIDLRFTYLTKKCENGDTELIMVPNQVAFKSIITITNLKKPEDFFC